MIELPMLSLVNGDCLDVDMRYSTPMGSGCRERPRVPDLAVTEIGDMGGMSLGAE